MPLILVSPYRLKAFFDGHMGTVQFTLPLTSVHHDYFSSVSNQAIIDTSSSAPAKSDYAWSASNTSAIDTFAAAPAKADYTTSASNTSAIDTFAAAPTKSDYASTALAEGIIQMSSITTH